MADGGRGGEEGELPEADAAADVVGKAQVVRRGAARHGRQRLQVGPEVGDVLRLHPGEGGVGEGGVEVPPVRRDPAQHGVGEVAGAPAADAVAPVAGDVGDDEVAEAGLQHPAAAELEAVLAFGLLRGVAGGAAAGPEPGLAAGRVAGGQRRQLGGRQAARQGQDIEDGGPGQEQPDEPAEEPPHRGSVLGAVGLVAGFAAAEDRLHRRGEGGLVGRAVLARRGDGGRGGGLELAELGLQSRPCPPRSSARRGCAPDRRCPRGRSRRRPGRWRSARRSPPWRPPGCRGSRP